MLGVDADDAHNALALDDLNFSHIFFTEARTFMTVSSDPDGVV